jgi:ABC-type branched-subunit amino acid transport system ATPase component
MNEGRKRVLLIAACILADRKLALLDKPCPAMETAIADGIAMAERIMRKIDALHSDKT